MPVHQNFGLMGLFALFFVSAFSTASFADVRRAYVDTPTGQVHYYVASPAATVDAKVPVVLLHAKPKSGEMFLYMLEDLGRDRVAIALDFPGAGGSDELPGSPTIADFADALANALRGLGYGEEKAGKIDIFGFHTGSVTLVEMALRHPDLIRKAIVGGVPVRSDEERAAHLERFAGQPAISMQIVEYAWQSNFELREEGVTFDDAARSFAENIRALSGKYWQPYVALWSYDLKTQLAKYNDLDVPTLILNYQHDVEYGPTLEAHNNYLASKPYKELEQVTATYHPFIPDWQAWNDALREWFDD